LIGFDPQGSVAWRIEHFKTNVLHFPGIQGGLRQHPISEG
jgi:hypothetical protein